MEIVRFTFDNVSTAERIEEVLGSKDYLIPTLRSGGSPVMTVRLQDAGAVYRVLADLAMGPFAVNQETAPEDEALLLRLVSEPVPTDDESCDFAFA